MALLHQMGGEAWVVPVPSAAGTHLEIGRLATLPALSSHGSTTDTRRLAHQLAGRGTLAVLFGQEPAASRVHCCVTLAPVRLATIDHGATEGPLIRRIRRVSQGSANQLAAAIALADALDLDRAGRRTFRLLHRLIERAVTLLPPGVPLEDRRSWALTQLTRLLFLRFVESEGWLDGNPRFLADRYHRCRSERHDPTRCFLHPLFFGTLNRPLDDRSRLARAFGAVPFLNGGLFEPHPIERRLRMRLPATFWDAAFADLVDRVDVSLDLDVDDGRVTSELLGRVFEGVMDGEERRREGAFFTPPELVEAITREAVACHLAQRLDRKEAMLVAALDDPDPQLLDTLLDLRVLDPAAGSGAFLVGALGVLHGPGRRCPRRVSHLVRHQLFGVDRHPGAVRLAELRLWLEVLRAHRELSPRALPPLPNLDTTIRAGDALIDPVLTRGLDARDCAALASHQAAVAHAHGQAKRFAKEALMRTEMTVTIASLRAQEGLVEARLTDLLISRRAPTLFGDRPPVHRDTLRTIHLLRRDRARLRTERRRLARDASSNPFAMAVAFAPILTERGGFDLVLGNPPWVRAERITPNLRAQLAGRYRWWTSGDGTGWRHLPDLAVAFVERSSQLLRPGGTLALLVPSKLATAGYATAMRAGLADRHVLHCVADLTDDPRAGFEATTYPLAIIASRRTAGPDHSVRLGLHPASPRIAQECWRDRTTWSLARPASQALSARLASRHPPLSARVSAHLGVKTGANAVFLNPPESLVGYCRRGVRGRDVRPFTARTCSQLLWPADARGTAWRELPPEVAHYLHGARAQLERRVDLQGGPWWRLFRTEAATAPNRVVWCDLAPRLRATTLPDEHQIPLNSCYVATLPSASAADALTAWLNSTWIRSLARLVAEPAAGNCFRFGARAVGSVPLPPEVLGDPVLASLTQSATDHDVTDALDERVAQILELEEIDQEILRETAGKR